MLVRFVVWSNVIWCKVVIIEMVWISLYLFFFWVVSLIRSGYYVVGIVWSDCGSNGVDFCFIYFGWIGSMSLRRVF